MSQEFYTPEEVELLRAQLRNGVADAKAAATGRYRLHPRIIEMRAGVAVAIRLEAAARDIDLTPFQADIDAWAAGLITELPKDCRGLAALARDRKAA